MDKDVFKLSKEWRGVIIGWKWFAQCRQVPPMGSLANNKYSEC